MESDAHLVSRVRAGDTAAFRLLYQRYEQRVFRFLVRLANDRAVAEDLFQETWLALARATPRLEPVDDLAPLLFTIARNKFLNWRRWALLDISRLNLFGRSSILAALDGVADARQELRVVERALAELPVGSREILLLVAIEGLEPSQAAAVLGIQADAARQRLARARSQLADKMNGDLPSNHTARKIEGEGR
jgi:RNA polymerase sigma-70 factor (ECF subfamily)